MNDLFESRVSAGVVVLTDSLLMPHPEEGKGSGQIDSGFAKFTSLFTIDYMKIF